MGIDLRIAELGFGLTGAALPGGIDGRAASSGGGGDSSRWFVMSAAGAGREV
jgi:hypothetical protein